MRMVRFARVTQQFDSAESEALRFYVYVYVYSDPRNNQPFYIGKGNGNRAFAHLGDKSESAKVGRIAPEAVRKLYRWKSVAHLHKPGAANPIMYVGAHGKLAADLASIHRSTWVRGLAWARFEFLAGGHGEGSGLAAGDVPGPVVPCGWVVRWSLFGAVRRPPRTAFSIRFPRANARAGAARSSWPRSRSVPGSG